MIMQNQDRKLKPGQSLDLSWNWMKIYKRKDQEHHMQVGWHLLTILDLVLLLPTDSEICFWYRSYRTSR